MFEFKYETNITIKNIPLPWIAQIELYYPDLPQFPIIYIHTNIDNIRIYACPVAISYSINQTDCDTIFTLLTNTEPTDYIKNILKLELENRIGYSNKISKNDIINCCNNNKEYIYLLTDLWKYVEASYGKYIPYGKYYEEIYSIVRFVSAWQPKTGRQSEMRMLYNFMSMFGEKVKMPQKWSHLEFYIIPNLNDILSENFFDFEKFSLLNSVIHKLYRKFFNKSINISNIEFKVMEQAWKQNKDSFINDVSTPLLKHNIFDEQEKLFAEKLVDAFNRHTWRAAYFISSYINIEKNYSSWTKEFFIDFYNNGNKLKGYSEKVIACFLQQGFLNINSIPIDTWIKTFYEYPLGISNNSDFFKQFSNLGKLERIIWLSSQSNKTNMGTFFDILWCQRYGTNGNTKFRGINPISCYSCKLKNVCVGLKSKLDEKIQLLDNVQPNSNSTSIDISITYVCYLIDGVPKKCYLKNNLIDEFSGYILTSKDKLPEHLISKKIISMQEFVYH